MPSGNGDHEKSGDRVSCSSPAGPVFADTLHELANAVTVLLVNAQVLEWKLPPYSRLKRPVREIERHAQRGGALLKRLLHFTSSRQRKTLICWNYAGELPSCTAHCSEVWLR